jgi:hypothetical protein
MPSGVGEVLGANLNCSETELKNSCCVFSDLRSRFVTCGQVCKFDAATLGSVTVATSCGRGGMCFHKSPSRVRFSNRPFRVKRFQTIHHSSVDVAHGLVLLFGIGTRGPSIMGFEERWNNLSGGLAVRRTVGPSGLANSPHPSSREGHHSTARWSSIFLSIGFDPARFSCFCRGLFPGPAELGAVNPYAVHDHSQPACQGHDRLLHPAAPGDLHRPGFEPGPFLRPQHALSCFVEHDPHHLISVA